MGDSKVRGFSVVESCAVENQTQKSADFTGHMGSQNWKPVGAVYSVRVRVEI